MLDDIKSKLETINSRNGYAVFPRQVVVIVEAGEIHNQPERTVAIVSDGAGFGVMVNARGVTRQSLRTAIESVLDGFELHVSDQVITVQTPPDDHSGTPDTA